MSNQSSLKPCPFCGGRGESVIHKQWYKIVCQNCHAEIYDYPTYADAGHRWNERANEAELKRRDDEIASLKRLLKTLHQGVWDNCPELLDEDRDGNWQLDVEIVTALEGVPSGTGSRKNLDELFPDDRYILLHSEDDSVKSIVATTEELKEAIRESMEYIVDSRIRDLVNCGSIKV